MDGSVGDSHQLASSVTPREIKKLQACTANIVTPARNHATPLRRGCHGAASRSPPHTAVARATLYTTPAPALLPFMLTSKTASDSETPRC